MKVCKFGGTSLADAGQVRKIVDIMLADKERRIIVVSAPGKRSKTDTKVTDMLIACAKARLSGGTAEAELKAVTDRYASICADLGLPADVSAEIAADLKTVVGSDTSHEGRYMDAVKAAGEDNSARFTAAEFVRRGVKARYLNPKPAGLLLTEEFGNAQLIPESYAKLSAIKDYDGITVFPGFFGFTKSGAVATFPRGGSDITGSILAAAVRADLYENFTDVDSVFAVDPSLVDRPAAITELTYREMRELSYAGFSVLHEEAILPTAMAGIPICIKNTNNPSAPGTFIAPTHTRSQTRVVGIASDAGFASLYIQKVLMNREIGFGRRVLQILEDEKIPFEHMPSGIDDVSVIIREKWLSPGTEEKVCSRLRKELKVDKAELERGLAIIMIVGEGMRFTVGMAAQATKALQEAEVNIEMINQGSSEISMMFGVKAVDRKKAVAALYKAFFG
jgi:aspartate kinase